MRSDPPSPPCRSRPPLSRKASPTARCKYPGSAQPLPVVSRGARFPLHAESMRAGSVLAAEQQLEPQADGRGWARNMVNRLCIDLSGRVSEPCNRDNVARKLSDADRASGHRAPDRRGFRPAPPAPGVLTTATGRRGSRHSIATSRSICAPAMASRRRRLSTSPPVPTRRCASQPRSWCATFLSQASAISIASGEGNPDRAIALSDEGFCFRSYLGAANSAILPAEPRRL